MKLIVPLREIRQMSPSTQNWSGLAKLVLAVLGLGEQRWPEIDGAILALHGPMISLDRLEYPALLLARRAASIFASDRAFARLFS